MKLKLFTLSALVWTVPSIVSADTLGAEVLWSAFSPLNETVNNVEQKGEVSYGIEASFVHPIPFIPNVRAETSSIKTSEFKYLSSAATAYYQILDTDIVGFDFGFGMTAISSGKYGKSGNSAGGYQAPITEFNNSAAHLYMGAEVAMPFHNQLSLCANAYENLGSDIVGRDYKIGAQYAFDLVTADAVIATGFRKVSHSVKLQQSDAEKIDLVTNGLFVNLGVSF
jgi:outer membrane protein